MAVADTKQELPGYNRPAPRRRGGKAQFLAGVLFTALVLYLYPTIAGGRGHGVRTAEPDDAEIQAYWDAVTTRFHADENSPGASPGANSHVALGGARGRIGQQFNGMRNAAGEAMVKPGHGHGDDDKGCKWMSPKHAEKIYLGVPNNNSAALANERITAHAHPAGSGWDFATALQVKNDWERELGLKITGASDNLFEAGSADSQRRIKDGMKKAGVWIDEYYPVMNTPVSSSVTLFTDPPFEAKLREAQLKGDPTTELADEVRVFHGLSTGGDVKAQYVYAGYGRKADFELLQSKGIDFTGKIAFVKYGQVFRGLKVKAAQEAGAIGCVIFTDPGDDGEMTEEKGYKQYPDGPARVPSSVQRGSVQFLSMYPGDPTTPGEPAYKNATRTEGANRPSIPSLPMSYEDAIPILNALKGKGLSVADLDDSFGGGLGFYGVEYFTGPSEVELRVVNEVNTRVMPIWNTMAVIPGHITDEVVVMGNHRDAWVLGGSDPNAGTASQYEMVRGLGKLLRKGWRPLRSIVLASWDAEEDGLIGSTEWAEDFGTWLQGNAAAYLNLDSSTSGSNFHGSASPSLARLLRGAAEEVSKLGENEVTGRSVWDARRDGGDWDEFYGIASTSAADDGDEWKTDISPLGSGSDYTAFLMHFGVASTDFGFGGGPKDAVYHYHSIYDSHTWLAKFGDPEFHKHVEGAQIVGLVTLRLADALLLPLNTTQYAHDLKTYSANVAQLRDGDEAFKDLNLDALDEAIGSLVHASEKLDAERVELIKKLPHILPTRGYWESLKHAFSHALGACGHHSSASAVTLPTWDVDSSATVVKPGHGKPGKEARRVLRAIRKVNHKLKDFESGLISEEGITDREWYKHKGTSPGKWLGYGATTFPAVTEALTIEHDVSLAQREADELAGMIRKMGERLLA